jgi:DNA mismatch repair ATPase MutL
VYRVVSALVRKALSAGTAIPALSFDRSAGTDDDIARLRFGASQHSWPGAGERPGWGAERGEQVDPRTGEIVRLPALTGDEFARRLLTDPGKSGHDTPAELPGSGELRPGDRPAEGPVWQLHGKYILAPVREGIVIADQHVVHERVLYERILRRLEGSVKASQQLLFPVTIHVSASEASLIRDLERDLSSLGFDLKFFGSSTVVVDGVPSDLKPGQEERILQDTLELFREFRKETATSTRDTLAKSLSCRLAVKAGDTLTDDEMRALLEQLAHATMPYVCPHGRPVLLRLSTEELDRRFGRL